jgi:deoxyadenosine/deoxycytidine kinase
MANIRKRSRPYEVNMSEDYIRELNDAYNRFFFNYRDTPLLVINSTELDFVNNKQELDDLLMQLHRPISGVQYYSPTTSAKK